MSLDITDTLAPDSAQVNADDFAGRTAVVTVAGVEKIVGPDTPEIGDALIGLGTMAFAVPTVLGEDGTYAPVQGVAIAVMTVAPGATVTLISCR